ncbi:MAG: DNA polymerase III subunit gamma/tau [Pseudomonadales bacterium]|nr:DNA polymerase III subunit gamma/tau [Pseudomonadales bacterium]
MSYQVLARKLRPAGFDALVGQDHVVRALTHALDHDRVHHAYLFTGTRGVGKTTIARILAKCLNCETNGVSSSPCQTCTTCLDISAGRFLDLIEVDAASRTGVSDTRDLLENAQYLPVRGRYKVYLIDEVHMLSNAAFNALLKTLEEPPPHVKFLLATTEVKKVPVTVLSRCLQFQLKNLNAERIAAYLGEVLAAEGVTASPGALALIARAARGSMRDALSITDQAIAFGQGELTAEALGEMLGIVGRDEVGALLGALASGSADEVLAITAEFAERAVEFSTVLAELAAALHGLAVDRALGRNDGSSPFSAEALQLFYQIAIMGQRDLPLAPDPRSGAEMTLLRMLAFAPEPDSPVPPLTGRRGDASVGEPEASGGATRVSGQHPAADGVAMTAALERGEPDEGTPQAPAMLEAERDGEPWHAQVATCEAGGVTRMLLENCLPISRAGQVWELALDPRHDTLYNDSQRQAMVRALACFGVTDVRVRIEVARGETPAARKDRLRVEAQQAAEVAIADDPVVQTLLREFGGKVQRVTPMEPKPTV